MKIANIRYNLDVSFKKGTNMKKIRELRKLGHSINKYLNPKETSIYLWITIMGDAFKIRVPPVKILPIYWDFELQMPKETYEFYDDLTSKLGILKAKVRENLSNGYRMNPNITYEEMSNIVQDTVNGKTPQRRLDNFYEIFDLFLEQRRKKVTKDTIYKYESLQKVLKELERKRKRSITFRNVDLHLYDDLYDYLVNTKKVKNQRGGGIRKGLSNNSISKYIDNFKVFMKWAAQRGYHSNWAFKNFETETDEREIVFLEPQELKAVDELELSDNKILEQVRDVFMFQFYTGQRHGDLSRLKYGDLVKTNFGYNWILHQSKGRKTISLNIPIGGEALDILMKYKKEKIKPEDSIFPYLSNQKMNQHLKTIGKLAGLNQPFTIMLYSGNKAIPQKGLKYDFLTTHVARRTFVTLSVNLGMNERAVRGITGHTGARTMKPYLKVQNEFIKDEYDRIWGK